MSSLKSWLLGLLLMVGLSSSLLSEFKSEMIARCKKATALVHVKINRLVKCGTAFCIDESGVYVTNAYIVNSKSKGDVVSLTFGASKNSLIKVNATILLIDKSIDLALLKVEDEMKHVSLPLGDSKDLFETMSVMSFGKSRHSHKLEYMSSMVDSYIVTLIKKDKGLLDKVKLSKKILSGSSGGPVVNEHGKVIGVVVSNELKKETLDLMIPINNLKKLLQKPIVTVHLPKIEYLNRFSPAKFSVLVATILDKPKENIKVFVELTDKNGLKIKHELSSADKRVFSKNIIPFKKLKQKSKLIKIKITCLNGNIVGSIIRSEITINGKSYAMNNIKSMQLISKTGKSILHEVRFNDGSKITGQIKMQKKYKILLGEDHFCTMASKNISKLEFVPIIGKDALFNYSIRVNVGKVKVFSSKGTVNVLAVASIIKDSADKGVDGEYQELDSDKKTIKLPDYINDIAIGGGGRMMIFHLSKLKALAVFDCSKLKVVKFIPLLSSNIIFAAGGSKLIVVYKDRRLFQRISLHSFQAESLKSVSVKGEIKGIAMGSSNGDSFLLHWEAGMAKSKIRKFAFFDTKTLLVSSADDINVHLKGDLDRVYMRASSDGLSFGLWTEDLNSGFVSLVKEGSKVKSFYQPSFVGHLIPSYGGDFMLTGKAGKIPTNLKYDNSKLNFSALMPSTHPKYYFSIVDQKSPFDISIFKGKSEKVVFKVQDLSEMKKPSLRSMKENLFLTDKRYHLIPQYRLLITIPYANDKIYMRKLEFKLGLK